MLPRALLRSIRTVTPVVTFVVLFNLLPESALALCGDVTGEGTASTTDALLVLKLAVGQPVELTCQRDILDSSLSPNYGSISLTSGFVPDPQTKSVTAGGAIDVDFLGSGCRGFVTEAPDFRVFYTAGGSDLLRFYFVGSGDATMIVNDPHGVFSQCGDDSYATSNPTVDFHDPAGGAYDIWIGSFNEGEFASGTLYITELTGNHP